MDQAIREFNRENGTPGSMPSKETLAKAGRNDLSIAIGRKHGGFPAVAARLGLKQSSSAKAPGYWDKDTIINELEKFNSKRGLPNVMPTNDELREANLGQVAKAISKLGGPKQFAAEIGYSYKNDQRESGYWTFETLTSEIAQIAKQLNKPGVMPTGSELRTLGQARIENQIAGFGGSNTVADRMGFERSSSARVAGYYDDIENIKRDILAFAAKSPYPERMPSGTDLKNNGLSTLSAAISTRHGGFATVAKLVGLKHYGAGQGWTIEALRLFVKSLIDHLDAFTQAELQALLAQNGLWETGGKSRSFVRSLACGRFPKEELQKFASGSPSMVDNFIADPSDRFEHQPEDSDGDLEDVTHIISESKEDEGGSNLPTVSTNAVLRSLMADCIPTCDEETAEFLIASAIAKIWSHAYRDEESAVAEAKSFPGSSYASLVQERFLWQYERAKTLKMPKGYAFSVDGKVVAPNLMQRRVASLVEEAGRVGNWSGTGAGKTLSAVLATRVTGSNVTVVCCPNSVVEGWCRAIMQIFPECAVRAKTFQPSWTQDELSVPRYLVLNYEALQQPDSADKVRTLVEHEQVDFLVVDEIHYTKQRKADNLSKRRELVTALSALAAERNPDLKVLGMSATPVVRQPTGGQERNRASYGRQTRRP